MLLMSEGEPKIGSTWVYKPEANNVSLTQVPRTKSYKGTSWDGDDEPNIKKYALDSHDERYAQTFATMMSAGYWKKEVSKHYSEDANDPTKHPVHFYTVAIDENYADSPSLAEIALNPSGAVKSAESKQNGTMAERFKYLIKTLFKEGEVRVQSGLLTSNALQERWMHFNAKNGITEQDFYYNDARYLINDQEGDAKYEWDRILGSVVSEITSVSPQAPTQVTDEGEAASGYVTYTDPIGQYMEVKDVKGLVYADNVYHYSETKSNTTSYPKRYVFEGTVANGVYPSGDLKDLIVEVTCDDKGNETMTVKVPASLLPVRINTLTVDTTAEQNVVKNAASNVMPLRVCYSVGAKEDILTTSDDGTRSVDLSKLDADYVQSHYHEDTDSIDLYGGNYSSKTAGSIDKPNSDSSQTVGDASVQFTPAETNPFFYLTENAPLYYDKECSKPVTDKPVAGTRYYFKINYYNGTQKVDAVIERDGKYLTEQGYGNPAVEEINGQWVFTKGSIRLGNLNVFQISKEQNSGGAAAGTNMNPTQTADTVRYPVYNDKASGDLFSFTVYLGNNGRMTLPAAQALGVSKQVISDEGMNAPGTDFSYELTVEGHQNQTFGGIEYSSTDKATPFTGRFDGKGSYQFKLKDGEHIEFYGLEGSKYTITEAEEQPEGFSLEKVERIEGLGDSATSTPVTDDEGNAVHEVSGTLGDKDVQVAFTNRYATSATIDVAHALNITKALTGLPSKTHEFTDQDTFTFRMVASSSNATAPLPYDKDSVTATIKAADLKQGTGDAEDVYSASTSLGSNITFTKPGEYRYIITEDEPNGADRVLGVHYDKTQYYLDIVIVQDKKTHKLCLATPEEIAQMKQSGELDTKIPYSTNPYLERGVNSSFSQVDSIVFSNNYDLEKATLKLTGTKKLLVTNSDYKINSGDFQFKIEALGTVGESSWDNPTKDDSQPLPTDGGIDGNHTMVANIGGGTVQFGTMTFTKEMVDKCYLYRISEVIPDEATNPAVSGNKKYGDSATTQDERDQKGWQANGITYDAAQYITVSVSAARNDAGEDTGFVACTVTNKEDGSSSFTFENKYQPQAATLGGGISVQKTLDGREFKTDDKFSFKVENTASPAGVGTVLPEGTSGNAAVVTVTPDAENPQVAHGATGPITFPCAGIYEYQITEQLPEDDSGLAGVQSNGITYDGHTSKVRIEVTEDHKSGSLTVEGITYDNQSATTEADKNVTTVAAFTNIYKAIFNGELDKVPATKVLTGRSIEAGEFYLTVTGENLSKTIAIPAAQANNSGQATSSIDNLLDGLSFDKPGTYTYTVSEQQGVRKGVTYSKAVWHVTIEVTDNDGTGVLTASKPTVERITDEDTGKTLVTPVQDSIQFKNAYAPLSVEVSAASFAGSKTLTGRAMEAGEFHFTLAGGDDATKKAIESGAISLTPGAGDPAQGQVSLMPAAGDPAQGKLQTVAVPSTKTDEGKSAAFNFGDGEVTFKSPGSYTFAINETDDKGNPVPEQDAGTGLTYDTHIGVVRVEVVDVAGQLMATVTPGEEKESCDFTNSYKPEPLAAPLPAGAVSVQDESKELVVQAGQFQVVMHQVGGDSLLPSGEGHPN